MAFTVKRIDHVEVFVRDLEAAARFLEGVLDRQLIELLNEPVTALVSARYDKFRKMGQFFDLQA